MPKNMGTSRKGKPKAAARAAGMGRALMNAQQKTFKVKDNGSSRGAGMVSSGAGDLNIAEVNEHDKKSILEMDSLQDFILSAEMADREFESEKQQFVVIDSAGAEFQKNRLEEFGADGLTGTDRRLDGGLEVDRFDFEGLKVPRRPAWDETTTPAELDKNEKVSGQARDPLFTPLPLLFTHVRGSHTHACRNPSWTGAATLP